MNNLANRVSADAAMSSYLLEATRAAYGLSGAIDEDHRQLAVLEDEVNKTVVLITRLLDELSEDIARQSNYVSNERSNLNTLALAIKNGEHSDKGYLHFSDGLKESIFDDGMHVSNIFYTIKKFFLENNN